MMVWAALLAVSLVADEGLVLGEVEVVAEGFQFTEGPVWLPEGRLAFSDIPADTIYFADKSIAFQPSGKSNGLVLDREGRIIRCEHGNRRVVRIETDGAITVIADAYEGKKLNSPNDAVVRSDGLIFFTDPPYGLEGRTQELAFQGVYAVRPGSAPRLLMEDFERPNGIVLSPDEKTLYVADTQRSHVRAFDVGEDGTLSNGREFAEIGFPDGMAADEKGNIWVTGMIQGEGGVVAAFSPAGERVATVAFPQNPANCGFGGEDGKTLFATARTAVYKVRTGVRGLGFAAN